MMTKIYCDICGKEADCKKYLLPRYKQIQCTNAKGAVLQIWNSNIVTSEEYDLCDQCANKIILSIEQVIGGKYE